MAYYDIGVSSEGNITRKHVEYVPAFSTLTKTIELPFIPSYVYVCTPNSAFCAWKDGSSCRTNNSTVVEITLSGQNLTISHNSSNLSWNYMVNAFE